MPLNWFMSCFMVIIFMLVITLIYFDFLFIKKSMKLSNIKLFLKIWEW